MTTPTQKQWASTVFKYKWCNSERQFVFSDIGYQDAPRQKRYVAKGGSVCCWPPRGSAGIALELKLRNPLHAGDEAYERENLLWL